MAQIINTNLMSLNAQRNLTSTQSVLRPVCASTAPRTTRPASRSRNG